MSIGKLTGPKKAAILLVALGEAGAADLLREDLAVLGPLKVSDVEKSQQNMVKIARKLEEEGQITIGGRGGGDVI